MENALLLLKRVSTTWLSPGHSTWVVDMLLAFVCGLGLFLLLLPCLQGEPEAPPADRKSSRKAGPAGREWAPQHHLRLQAHGWRAGGQVSSNTGTQRPRCWRPLSCGPSSQGLPSPGVTSGVREQSPAWQGGLQRRGRSRSKKKNAALAGERLLSILMERGQFHCFEETSCRALRRRLLGRNPESERAQVPCSKGSCAAAGVGAAQQQAACGDCLDYLKETWNLISLLQSHVLYFCSVLGTVPANDSSYQPLDQDPPDKEYKRTAGGPPRPHWEHVDSTALAPLTKHLLPLASSPSSGPAASSVLACLPPSLTASQSPGPSLPLRSLSPQPLAFPLPPPCPPGACTVPPAPCSTPPLPGPALTLSQSDSMALPLDAITRSSSPPKHMLASPIPDISSLSHTSSAIPALPWWQLAAKALCLTTSSDSESQKGPLSHQPPRAVSLGVSTSRQMEAGNPSLHSSDDQNILGIKVTRKVEVKIWKEKEKDGTFLEQMSPGYNLSSLRNMLNSLGAKQDLTVPQPFWEIKDKVKQLLGPQQLSYSKVLGDHLQKYNQLFWGLPSLHSESLVAAAWISQGASALQPTCFLFNRTSSVCSVQVQDKMSPLLSQPQSPPLILSMSQFQPQTLGQFQTQVHLPSSFQALLPSSPPHIMDCAASGPTSQNKPQSLFPTEFQHTQMPWIGKQLGCGWALPSEVQRPQEVYNILPPHLSQDNCPDSILPENLPVSSELREQLEQHIQRWLMQSRWDQMQKSLELTQLREELAGTSQEVPGTCRAKDKPCPPQASLSIGDSSRDTQKVRFQLEKDTGKHLGHILGKVPKDPSKDLEVLPGKVQQAHSLDSVSNLSKLLKRRSDNDFSRPVDQNQLGSTLKVHLCLKSGQIQEGLVPWNVYQSWLSIKSTSSTSATHLESGSLALSESWDTCTSTCAKLPFLDATTQQTLEDHIIKLWVKHRWGLPLKVLKPLNLLKMTSAPPCMTLPEFDGPSSSSQVSGASSKPEVAKILGKPPQACPRGQALTDESVPTLGQAYLRGKVQIKEPVPTLGQAYPREKVLTDESVPALGQAYPRGKVQIKEPVTTLGQAYPRGKALTNESVPALGQAYQREKVLTDESVPTLGRAYPRGKVLTDESVPTLDQTYPALGQAYPRGQALTEECLPALGQMCPRGKALTKESVPTLGPVCPRGQALTDESVPTLTSLLLISSLAGKESERALTGVPPTHDHRLPEAPPALQESRPPPKTLTHNLLDRTLQSRTVQGTGKSSVKAPVLPRMSPAQYLGEPCLQAEDAGEFQQTAEMSLVSQPPVCAPEVCLPDCSTNTVPASDSLASPECWPPLQSKPFRKLPAPTLVNVLAARRSSLVPPKPRILRHQQKPHSKLYAPAYKGEDRRWPSSGNQKEMEELGTSKLTQVRGTEEMKQDPSSDGFFPRTWRRFLQWLFPEKKKIQEQEESLKRCRPPLASAQSPQSIKATASDNSNITEAQELMTTVGEMLEKKMALHHKCCASKLKQLREEHSPASQFPCYHRPPICPQQRGMSAFAVSPKSHSYPIRQRPDRSQQSLKHVQFNSQQWAPRHPHPWLSKKAGSPVSPSQHGPAMPGPSGHPHPCPRHRPRQGGVLSAQPANCSPVSSGNLRFHNTVKPRPGGLMKIPPRGLALLLLYLKLQAAAGTRAPVHMEKQRPQGEGRGAATSLGNTFCVCRAGRSSGGSRGGGGSCTRGHCQRALPSPHVGLD
ncbi:Hypothetical predicted protein [Marmota monax]|uniref:SPATA31 domain-containing protein n=1 Tax=Marmota monax TaxID=9995 RepID=A0A5E4BV39_MARMO|nr:Hypothetical predicted protein [Marmota monax]